MLIIIISAMIIFLVCFFAYKRKKEVSSKEIQARYLIDKVEEYRAKYHKLPLYESDMHLDLPEEYPCHYAITKDSTVYIVGFEVAPFKSMVYYSDSKTWIPQK